MTRWQALEKMMRNRTTARLALPIAVLVLGSLAAPYAAGALSFLVRPGTAAFLGGFIAVLLSRVLSPDRR